MSWILISKPESDFPIRASTLFSTNIYVKKLKQEQDRLSWFYDSSVTRFRHKRSCLSVDRIILRSVCSNNKFIRFETKILLATGSIFDRIFLSL